eukprot:CAMPEP_0113916176 /NCGR_PEP_ID=MMETSP0780_2-20120614/31835_1 /TAXON_ID=652834 /ORGANISM="Palpitomonas bilix" /LENGTH=228 /DNA_ID=CAMNT_0000915213 /DNA_START=36 /DNA_END=722 /DNA_ORIENTATION=+ /assembly_acc=CAM_ASM_000599
MRGSIPYTPPQSKSARRWVPQPQREPSPEVYTFDQFRQVRRVKRPASNSGSDVDYNFGYERAVQSLITALEEEEAPTSPSPPLHSRSPRGPISVPFNVPTRRPKEERGEYGGSWEEERQRPQSEGKARSGRGERGGGGGGKKRRHGRNGGGRDHRSASRREWQRPPLMSSTSPLRSRDDLPHIHRTDTAMLKMIETHERYRHLTMTEKVPQLEYADRVYVETDIGQMF